MVSKTKKGSAATMAAELRVIKSLAKVSARNKKNPPTRKSRKAARTQSQGGRFGRRAPLSSICGDRATMVSNVTHVPIAFNSMMGNTTWINQEGKVTHPREGIGLVLVGCQPFTDIATTAGDSNLFTTGTLATADPNVISLSPDVLNGPLAAQANLHQKYVFTDIMVEFSSNVATTQAGSMALAYSMDGAEVTGSAGIPTSFSTTRQLVPSITFPFRADHQYLHYHYSGDQTWFTATDAAGSLAGNRWTRQGAIIGFPSASSIGAVTQGYTNIYYRVELYQPTNSQGFTLDLSSREEREVMKRIYNRMFPKVLQAVPEERDWEAEVEDKLRQLDLGLWDDASSSTGRTLGARALRR
jgi:hypothetical protein